MAFGVRVGAFARPLGDYFTDPAANGNSFVRTVESALSRSAKIERTSATTETDSFNDEENQLVFVGRCRVVGGNYDAQKCAFKRFPVAPT